ncbi:LAFA_0F13850g1_1 [Lachancea sp. 'fantastica']|nr:LAFA_0F13850g1_1 [Lachancea sp. 'fantastica']
MAEEVSGRLSSRVLNMKFMRQADQAEEAQKQDEEKRQFIDSSEWKLAGNDHVKARLRPQWQSVGATALWGHPQATGAVGRRKLGVPEKTSDERQQEADLETLWKSQKRSRGEEEESTASEGEPEASKKRALDDEVVEKKGKDSRRPSDGNSKTSQPSQKRVKSGTAGRQSKKHVKDNK